MSHPHHPGEHPQGPPRVPIPLTWLESNFATRARTEQLLRPELDTGLITQRDFDAALAFFPGAQRYYSMAGGVVGTLSIFVYAQLLRRPPLPIARVASLAMFASAGGVLGGTVVRANAHADFFRTLDNRLAFFQAITNIQARQGDAPEAPDAFAPPPAPERSWGDDAPLTPAPGSSPAVERERVPSSPGPTQPTQPSSRWAEIRAEHARNAGVRSSWDELRQRASRPQAAGAPPPEHQGDPDNGRLSEQQRFDAVLEAERRRAEGSQGSSWGPST